MEPKTINRTKDLGARVQEYVRHLARGGRMVKFGVQQATYAVPRADLGTPFMEYELDEAELVGLQALALFPTQKKAATASVVTREGLLRVGDTKRAPGGAYNRDDILTEDMAYACEENGQEQKLDDGDRAMYASDFDAEEIMSMTALNRLLLAQEIRIAALLFNTGTWSGAPLTTTVSTAWGTVASATPVEDVLAAKAKVRALTGLEPNALILSRTVYNNLLRTAAIRAEIKYVAVPTAENIRSALAALFDVRRLLVGGAVYNAAIEGQPFSGSDVWGSGYAMVARIAEAAAPLQVPCVGRTLLWTQDSPENVVVEQYRENQTRSDIFRVRQHTNEKVIDPSFAHLIDITP